MDWINSTVKNATVCCTFGPDSICATTCGTNCRRIFAVKGQHSLDVALRESLFLGQLVVQIAGEPGNYPRAPAFLFLAVVDQGADLPIETDQLGIDR
jgi:hypothetical protein